MTASLRQGLIFNSRTLYLAVLFVVWCGANSLYATDAHKLLFNERSFYLFVDLTVIQSLTGALCSLLVTKNPINSIKTILALPNTKLSSVQIGACHFIGTLFTNASFCIIGATSTLVWKLAEPFLTVVLKYVILREKISSIRFIGVVTIVSGVFIFSNLSFSGTLAVSPILIANLAFPLRNVLVKAQQRNKAESEDDLYWTDPALGMYVYSLPFALFGVIIKSSILSVPLFQKFLSLVQNSTYFSIYQIASILLLSRLDALTHAVANLVKRFFTISITAILLGVIFSVQHITGLVFTGIGLIVYALGDKFTSFASFGKPKNKSIWRYAALILPMTVCLAVLNAKRITKFERLDDKVLFSNMSINRKLSSLPKIADVIDNGLIMLYYKYEPSYEYSDNVGNWVWQYGAHVAIPDFSESKICATLKICRESIRSQDQKVIHYSPLANMFTLKLPDYFENERNNIEENGDSVLIVGVGMQAEYFHNLTNYKIGNGMEIQTTPKDFKFTPNALSFLQTMQKHKIPMTFRGDFTWMAANLAGYEYGISLGCPSLMINSNPYLGKILSEKYKQLKNRISDRSLKIALNVQFYSNPEFFKRIIREYPNSIIYAQAKNEAEILYKEGVPMNRIRIFGNVEDWRSSLKEMDLSIGVRIHGNMIALAAEIPVLVIAPDHRVLELVQRMHVPHTIGPDIRLRSSFDVAELVSSVEFDPINFDLNRCRTAQTYKALLSRYRIQVKEDINHIASICSNIE